MIRTWPVGFGGCREREIRQYSPFVPTDKSINSLTGPGQAFEVINEDVLGHELQVYRGRLGSMRALIDFAAARGDSTFLVQGDRRLTFNETIAMIRRCAHSLLDLGLEPGDRVAILSANCAEWVVAFWACASAGLIAVPLNAWWKSDELQFALTDSGSRAVVCDPRRYELISPVLGSVPNVEHVFVIDSQDDDLERFGAEVEPFSRLLEGPAMPVDPGTHIDEDDIAGIFYTSGTTGKPKGATVTHRQVVANLQNLMVVSMASALDGAAQPELGGGGSQPAALLIVPLFHTTGCHATMVTSFASGSKLVLMPPGRFDPVRTMQTIQDEKVSSIGGVPTIMWRILEAPERGDFDLSSVSRISYGGAPASAELAERIAHTFPNAKSGLAQAYGLTESASVATMNAGEEYLRKPKSVGRAVPTVEIRIVDDELSDLPTGEAGEILLRGPTVSARGYWNRPDANQASYVDGWFRTGDVGRLDSEGYLYIVDRAKDLIIRAGENISCPEVEHTIETHPDIVEVAVVGVPHKELGEEVKAVVYLADSARGKMTQDDVREFARGLLADFKVPRYVEFIDDPLPRNPAGKILKQALRGAGTSFAAGESDSAL